MTTVLALTSVLTKSFMLVAVAEEFETEAPILNLFGSIVCFCIRFVVVGICIL